jgi:hypothetical protein
MDIVVWLRSLGLGKYEAAFRENDIDETVLPSLTHENLKELGVTSLGHRVKLLDAIAALRNDAGGKAPHVDAASTSTAPGGVCGRPAIITALQQSSEFDWASGFDGIALSASAEQRASTKWPCWLDEPPCGCGSKGANTLAHEAPKASSPLAPRGDHRSRTSSLEGPSQTLPQPHQAQSTDNLPSREFH